MTKYARASLEEGSTQGALYLSNSPASGYYETLLSAPTFSDDPIGVRQSRRWQLIVDDIHHSTCVGDLREARGGAEGHIQGLVDAGHLSHDRIRDYKILSSIHRVARPRDAGLVARRIATVHHALYASAADTRPFEKQMFMGYD